MMNQRTTAGGFTFVLFLLCLTLTSGANAGVVSQASFVKTVLSKHKAVKQQRSHLEVLLDLSGYRDAAVAFDFASLMRRDASGFKVGSASSVGFRNDFRLVSPIRTAVIRGQNRASVRRGEPGFGWSNMGRRYSTAMFNLAAYDGQTVLLTLDFDRRAARRRGMVNINNLRVAVSQIQSGPAGAAIPEPATALLLLAAALALLLVPAKGRPVAPGATRIAPLLRGEPTGSA